MRLRVAKDVMPLLLGICLLGIGVSLFYPPGGIAAVVCIVMLLIFFRDPARPIHSDSDIITAPADGKIVEITEVYEGSFLKETAQRISIFLSLLDVHINYSPIKGAVQFLEYKKGRFAGAYFTKASESNERNSIGITNGRISVMVRQIAGFIARRIVCYCSLEDRLLPGQKIGLIKFGSRVDIFLPRTVELTVKPGERVKAGITVLGVIKNNEEELCGS